MADKRKRGQNFSCEDKDKLVKLLALFKETILNKKTDGSTNEAKNKAWIDLTNAFNASATVYRSKESLMKVWEKLKSESKLYYQSSKISTTATGGGPSEVKIDPILEQVCALLGRACTGIVGVLDCDHELIVEINNVPVPPKKPCFNHIKDDEPSVELTLEDNDREIIVSNDMPESQTTQAVTETNNILRTPLWSRRRPQLSHTNERREAVSSLCSSFSNVNKKREDIEELRRQLLEDEINFKRRLYELQLQAAAKDVEIKDVMLNQLKGGTINFKTLFGIPHKDQ